MRSAPIRGELCLELHIRREVARRAWRRFFADWDVLVWSAPQRLASRSPIRPVPKRTEF